MLLSSAAQKGNKNARIQIIVCIAGRKKVHNAPKWGQIAAQMSQVAIPSIKAWQDKGNFGASAKNPL